MLVNADDLFKKIGYNRGADEVSMIDEQPHELIVYWKEFAFGDNKYVKDIIIDTKDLTSYVTCYNIDADELSYRYSSLNYTEQTVVCRKLKELMREKGEEI